SALGARVAETPSMTTRVRACAWLACAAVAVACATDAEQQVSNLVTAPTPITDPLPSWNDTPAKRAIMGFVSRVTNRGSQDYLPPSERIAVFDNDGTLWAEQPTYVQEAFDHEQHDLLGELDTADSYESSVLHWIATARNPVTKRLYTQMV